MGDVVLFVPTAPVKLEIGGGTKLREGFEQTKFDHLRFPWPLEDSSVDELHAAHVVERIPLENVNRGPRAGQDLFLAFFEEAFRVLKPGATMTVHVPNASADLAYLDPRNRRFFTQGTFACLSADGRKQLGTQGVPLPAVECDFGVTTEPSVDVVESLKSPEAAAERFKHLRNVCLWFRVLLKSNKPTERTSP